MKEERMKHLTVFFSTFLVLFSIMTGCEPQMSQAQLDNWLFQCIEENKMEELNLAIKKGANVNALNENSHTPLIRAVINGQKEIVEILLNAGADINYEESLSQGNSLFFAVSKKMMEIAEILLSHGAKIYSEKFNCMLLAVQLDSPEIVKALLKHGADPLQKFNYGDEDDATLLMIAAQEGSLSVMPLLIEAGVDVNARDSLGDNAINHIGMYKALDRNLTKADLDVIRKMVEFLLSKGCKMNVIGVRNGTVMDHLIWLGTNEAREILREYGALTAGELHKGISVE
jgi:hypothetical protein